MHYYYRAVAAFGKEFYVYIEYNGLWCGGLVDGCGVEGGEASSSHPYTL